MDPLIQKTLIDSLVFTNNQHDTSILVDRPMNKYYMYSVVIKLLITSITLDVLFSLLL